MCGVIGVKLKQELDEESFNNLTDLIYESRIRGMHAYGFSFLINNEIVISKTLSISKQIIRNILLEMKTDSLLFHSRYSTSGDFYNKENNQPICVNGVALVFNGILSMKNKQIIEKDFNITMATENDGEVFIRQCDDTPNKYIAFLKENYACSFAGIILSKKSFFAIRNNKRPMYLYEDNKLTIVCSTLDIFLRSNFDIHNIRIINPYEVINLNGI